MHEIALERLQVSQAFASVILEFKNQGGVGGAVDRVNHDLRAHEGMDQLLPFVGLHLGGKVIEGLLNTKR